MSGVNPFWLMAISVGMAAVPFFVLMGTSYLKVSIVFGMLRSGLGTQNTPGPMTVSALALAVSAFVMGPTIEESFSLLATVESKNLSKESPAGVLKKIAPAVEPFRTFLYANTGERELRELQDLSGMGAPPGIRHDGSSLDERQSSKSAVPADAPDLSGVGSEASSQSPSALSLRILLPGFVLTELKEAFTMACILLLPFLVLDLIVANVLVGLGMTMVSPVTVSLPLKLLVFVYADGWLLLTKGLILSYGRGGGYV